jgi:hypothetical protein
MESFLTWALPEEPRRVDRLHKIPQEVPGRRRVRTAAHAGGYTPHAGRPSRRWGS